jgi:hypothetical protein
MSRHAAVRAAAAALLAVAVLAPAGPAGAAGCARGDGVTVVVDFGSLGGGIQQRCDSNGGGRAASEVMSATGFSLTYVTGQAFVCRIDGLPTPEDESCARTPPSDAYWGLFWSDGDPATWIYSSEGVASLEVPEGGSIGWRFQNGGGRTVPGAAPNAAASPTPTPDPKPKPRPTPKPKPTPKPTPQPTLTTPPASEPSPTVGTVPDDTPTPTGTPTRSARPKPEKTAQPAPTDEPTSTPTPSPSEEVTDDITAAAGSTADPGERGDAGSSGAWTTVAGSLILLLAAAAGTVAWRRRS